MQKNVSVAKQVKSQYWFSWVHLSTESNGQNNVSGFGSPPLHFSFDLSDYVLIFLIFQALNTAKCAAASVGCIYILKRNWLCILGHSFVSSRIWVYVYLFIFFALCLIISHILSPNAISKYLLQPSLLFAFLAFDLRITFATNSQFLLTINN